MNPELVVDQVFVAAGELQFVFVEDQSLASVGGGASVTNMI